MFLIENNFFINNCFTFISVLNSLVSSLSAFINSNPAIAWGVAPSQPQPFCHGLSSKYFWSKFWRRKSKSFVNSRGTSPAPSRPPSPPCIYPLGCSAASSKHLVKVQPQPFRCGNSPGGVVYVPKSDREGAGQGRAGQAVSSCGLLCGQNFDGVCIGWRRKGEGEVLRAALAFRRQKGCCGKICVNFAHPQTPPPSYICLLAVP